MLCLNYRYNSVNLRNEPKCQTKERPGRFRSTFARKILFYFESLNVPTRIHIGFVEGEQQFDAVRRDVDRCQLCWPTQLIIVLWNIFLAW